MTSSTPDRQPFLRDLLLLLGPPLLLLVALLSWWQPWNPKVYAAARAEEVFALVAGTWDWEGADSLCVANPHTISFSPDHQVMYLAHRRPWTDSTGAAHRVAEYDIREFTPSRIQGLIRGETRRTDQGQPVVWDLVLTSRDSYAWHRTDWPPAGRTKEIHRCPPGSDSLVPPP